MGKHSKRMRNPRRHLVSEVQGFANNPNWMNGKHFRRLAVTNPMELRGWTVTNTTQPSINDLKWCGERIFAPSKETFDASNH